ncbi:MAG: hypothetical protein ACTSUE_17985 [Promethearchaeota archaeon]
MKGEKLTVISPAPANLHDFIKKFASQFKSFTVGPERKKRFNIETVIESTGNSVTFIAYPDTKTILLLNDATGRKYEEMTFYLSFYFKESGGGRALVVRLFLDVKGPKNIKWQAKITSRHTNRSLAMYLKDQVTPIFLNISNGHGVEEPSEMIRSGTFHEKPLPKARDGKLLVKQTYQEPASQPEVDTVDCCPYCGHKLKHNRAEICPGCKAML